MQLAYVYFPIWHVIPVRGRTSKGQNTQAVSLSITSYVTHQACCTAGRGNRGLLDGVRRLKSDSDQIYAFLQCHVVELLTSHPFDIRNQDGGVA